MGVKTRKLGNINDSLIQWQAVVTAATLNASAGKGYFIDTSSNACTVTITASGSATAGDTIVLKDYARNWGTNAVTIASNKFDGVTNTPTFNTNGQSVTLVHMGATKGWSLINEDTTTGLGAEYMAATGGTVTTSGDFKIHAFTGDSNFVVSNGGNSGGSNTVDYLVIAGGGGGGHYSGGGGAGGFRESHSTPVSGPYTASPLATPTGITVSAQTYPITVGGGGAGGAPPATAATDGSNSVFSTITSTGGGGAASGESTCNAGRPGGSGGASAPGSPSGGGTVGNGNTPPVSPPQGNNGGQSHHEPGSYQLGGGGGGAGAVGESITAPFPGRSTAGVGGAGVATAITGSSVTRAGGGGGASDNTPRPGGAAGAGGGGAGASTGSSGVAGTANTGGGGGGGRPGNGFAGGKGLVIIRYKFQN